MKSLKNELLALLDVDLVRVFVVYFEVEWMSKQFLVWNFYKEDMKTNNAAEAYHSFLKRRHGALRRPGYSLLLSLLQKLQFQQSIRVVRLQQGAQPRSKTRSMRKSKSSYKSRGKNLMLVFLRTLTLNGLLQADEKAGRLSIEIISCCRDFLTEASKLVPDVNVTGLRTKKAERAAKNKKRASAEPIPQKPRKKLKVSAMSQPRFHLDLPEKRRNDDDEIQNKAVKKARLEVAVVHIDDSEDDVSDLLGDSLDEICAANFGIILKKRDIELLKPGQWLNGELISHYFQLIAKRSSEMLDMPKVYSFDSLFYPQLVKKNPRLILQQKMWKDVQLFFYDILLIPIHSPGH
uniref:Ubiquitin-like protease family profile domain-containing protein n=1 Tax=Ditylenchus dipsaci TaxID=166011 RepID=A0A915ESR2_9BILA